MGPTGTVAPGGNTQVRQNTQVTAPTGTPAPTSNAIPTGPAYRDGMTTIADSNVGAVKAGAASGQDQVVPAHQLATDNVSSPDGKDRLNFDQMAQLYPGMVPSTRSPGLPFKVGTENVTLKHEGEALKDGNLLYVRYNGILWTAPVKPDSIWLERMDDNGNGIVHRTDKGVVNGGETATLAKIAHEKGVVFPVACLDISTIDKNAREAAARARGLDPSASWDDIKKFDTDKKQAESPAEKNAREAAANTRRLDPSASWADIKKFDADKKRAEQVAAAIDRAARAAAAKVEANYRKTHVTGTCITGWEPANCGW